MKRFFALFALLILIAGIAGCSVAEGAKKEKFKEAVNDASDSMYKHTFTYFNSEYKYSIFIPDDWYQKFRVEEDKNVTRFIYNSKQHPEYKDDIFAIHAFTIEQWEKVKDEPGYGQEITRSEKYVYVYTVGLDNPYEDSESEEYRDMVQAVHIIMKDFKVE